MLRRATLLLIAALLAVARPGHAAQTYEGVFAPQEGKVAAVERPARDEICLDGRWDFQPVPLPGGPAPALPAARPDGWDPVPIKIPSPWNVNGFAQGPGGDFRAYPSYPKAWESVHMAWMRRRVTVPAAWSGKRVLLRFEAVAGDAQVLVNGQTVARHFENFLPFEADVTSAIRLGQENEIRVGVRRPILFDHAGNRNGYRPYPAGSFWGPYIAGIWQDVFLVAVPAVHVADVFVQPLLDQDALRVEATVRNDTAQPATVSVAGSVRPWAGPVAAEPSATLGDEALAVPAVQTTVPAGQSAKVTLQVKPAGRLKPWTPDSPSLYGLIVRAGDDVRYTRFGWRQVGISGQKLLLNGQPITLKGDAWHFMGIPQMTRRYAWGWFRMLKDAGANAVRLHAQPYPSFYLDVADEMGIMVLDESAIWASDGGLQVDSPDLWPRCKAHVQALVLRDRNHPSVFGWSVANELLGVIHGVYHAPRSFEEQALEQFAQWAAACRELDPTRSWISGDGEEDAGGRLPIVVLHYPRREVMQRWSRGPKPWAVGEATLGYNGTPREVAAFNGERAYESMAGRMEGLARETYEHLKMQFAFGASYCSVFNLAWYGLQPLELGLADTSHPPQDTDGIFFTRFVDGQPGAQPERLGPYCTTINPGWDPRLPLYRPWAMFEAARDAYHGSPSKWADPPAKAAAPVPAATVERVAVLGSRGARPFADLGVPVGDSQSFAIVDGANPPGGEAAGTVKDVLARGGTVLVWGASRGSLAALNAVLPIPLALSDRKAWSLVPRGADPLTAGLLPSQMYFAESNPVLALDGGLDGPLVQQGRVLLEACNTDWRRWNDQPEYFKTGSVLRSEREAKGSGAALVAVSVGKGRLVAAKIDVPAQRPELRRIFTRLMRNLGVAQR